MSESQQISIRLPQDILDAIALEMSATGRGRTQVIIDRLRSAYGADEDASPSLAGRLELIEGK